MQNETLHAEPTPPGMEAFRPATSRGQHLPGTLVDRYGRHIRYLRLSVTDRCDFRCSYCMAEEMVFLPRSAVLSLEECLRLAGIFVGLGVEKLRITGGEPLVRKDILWLIERLGALPGLQHLVMTTNGSQLDRFAVRLKAAGVERLNISLDSLDAGRFHTLTRIGDLDKVLRGIAAAQAAGFTRIKLNTVMMRGFNDDELPELVKFAVAQQLDISFIEQMPLGAIGDRQRTYFSSEEARSRLSEHFELLPSPESSGGPARYWRIPGTETRVGFISPHSHNFCDSCNRVRLTAKGELYPCLGHNDAISLLPLLRAHPEDDTPIRQAIIDGMGIKPWGHDFTAQMDQPQVVRFMSTTGG